ncbi:hypothetical protein [Actinomyces massiliensis]|uniref:hypothetical protein n=1 Tax=Actinomyces massiliensis TaxID=461393 RepID=UPI001EE64C6C|nr:hypothetical protein [Actinomyces massiliensis]
MRPTVPGAARKMRRFMKKLAAPLISRAPTTLVRRLPVSRCSTTTPIQSMTKLARDAPVKRSSGA